MITIAIKYKSVPELFGDGSWLDGFLMEQSDGNWAIQLPDDKGQPGKFLSVQPDGSYQTRDEIGGTYEIFKLNNDLNTVQVKPRILTYKIAIRES